MMIDIPAGDRKAGAGAGGGGAALRPVQVFKSHCRSAVGRLEQLSVLCSLQHIRVRGDIRAGDREQEHEEQYQLVEFYSKLLVCGKS